MASSGPMIASTFWKNTIPLCTGCDQSTAWSSSWWSEKLPAVWKNFLGTIGARSLTSASGRRSPVSPAAPPRSNHSRVDAQSSSTTTASSPSPSRRPTRPASKVTSFMTATRFRSAKVTFVYIRPGAGAVSTREGRLLGRRDAEDPELEGQGGVVADQGEQLEQAVRAELGRRLAVLRVVEVTRGGQRGGGARDHGLAPGQPIGLAVHERGEVGVGQAGGA